MNTVPNYSKRKVFIVADDRLMRDTLAMVINGQQAYCVTGSFETFELAHKAFLKSVPDIILMDINLQGASGVEGVKQIRKSNHHVQVIMISIREGSDNELIFEALKAGANGYLSKGSDYVEIISAMDEVMNGGAPMSSKIARMVINNFYIELNSPLSNRERQILTLLSEGKTYSEIAQELLIAKETSKTHIRNIYAKLHVNSKSQALFEANKQRLI